MNEHEIEKIKELIKDFVMNHMNITEDNLDRQVNKFIEEKVLGDSNGTRSR